MPEIFWASTLERLKALRVKSGRKWIRPRLNLVEVCYEIGRALANVKIVEPGAPAFGRSLSAFAMSKEARPLMY